MKIPKVNKEMAVNQEGGDTLNLTADSCCCAAEINTTL